VEASRNTHRGASYESASFRLSVSLGPGGSGNGSVTCAAAQNTTRKQRSGKITVYLTATPTKAKVFSLIQKK
jgi:hypothetical protein